MTMLHPKAGPDHRAVIIRSQCKSVSPWHPSLCPEIIHVVSAIIVATNNNILTIVVWTQKAAVRGKVIDGGWSFVF